MYDKIHYKLKKKKKKEKTNKQKKNLSLIKSWEPVCDLN